MMSSLRSNNSKAGENRNNQIDDKQPKVKHGQEGGSNKQVSQATVMEHQKKMLAFPESVAHCVSADFRLGAGLAIQMEKNSQANSPRTKNTCNK